MAGALLLVAALAQTSSVWPMVQPVDRSFSVDLRARVISFDLPLLSSDGRQVYVFWCEGGTDFSALNGLSERHRVNDRAALMCVLNEGTHRDEGSLLAEHDEAPWFSRALIRGDQLAGACSSSPDSGERRIFRLRGLVLTVRAEKVRNDRKGVRSFTLRVTVQPDETALTSRAAAPGLPVAGDGTCNSLAIGREPAVCEGTADVPGSCAP
jgi:hypothetical protein